MDKPDDPQKRRLAVIISEVNFRFSPHLSYLSFPIHNDGTDFYYRGSHKF